MSAYKAGVAVGLVFAALAGGGYWAYSSQPEQKMEPEEPNVAQQATIDMLNQRGKLVDAFMQGGLQDITIYGRTFTALVRENDQTSWQDMHIFCLIGGKLVDGEIDNIELVDDGDYYSTRWEAPAGSTPDCSSVKDKHADAFGTVLTNIVGSQGPQPGTAVVEQNFVVTTPAYVDLYKAQEDTRFFAYFKDPENSGIVCEGSAYDRSVMISAEGKVSSRRYMDVEEYNTAIKGGYIPAEHTAVSLRNCAPVTPEDNNRHHQRFDNLLTHKMLP